MECLRTAAPSDMPGPKSPVDPALGHPETVIAYPIVAMGSLPFTKDLPLPILLLLSVPLPPLVPPLAFAILLPLPSPVEIADDRK